VIIDPMFPPPPFDEKEARRYLKYVFDPFDPADGFLHLRAINGYIETPKRIVPSLKPAILSGDYDDLEAILKSLGMPRGVNVYSLINPVKIELLDQSANHYNRLMKRSKTIGDNDVARLRWAYLDGDTIHPKETTARLPKGQGISATDEQLEYTLSVGRSIVDAYPEIARSCIYMCTLN
jgi:hypothetical protein